MSTDDEVIVSTLIDAVTSTGKRSPVRRKATSPNRRRSSRLQLEHLEPREVPAVVAATSESPSTDDASSEVLQASQMSAFFEQSSLYTDGQPTTDPTESWSADHSTLPSEPHSQVALEASRMLDLIEAILIGDQAGGSSVMDDFHGFDEGGGGGGGGGLPLNSPFLRLERAWPTAVFAPYVDLSAWPTFDMVHGPQAKRLHFFHLAFISADSFNRPSWGGDQERALGSDFDLGVRRQVSDLRARAGDVAISFGGPQRLELAQVITDPEKLKRAYRDVIEAYGLARIDFHLEQSSLADTAANDRRSRALASLQRDLHREGRKLVVWFTLPAGPTGLSPAGVATVDTALARGVTLGGVNLCPHGHDDTSVAGSQARMGAVAIESAINAFYQLDKCLHRQETAGDVWRKIGMTPTIGRGDADGEQFLPADARAVYDFARQQGVGMLGEWSINRDQYDSSAAAPEQGLSSGVDQQAFEFSDIFAPFTARAQ